MMPVPEDNSISPNMQPATLAFQKEFCLRLNVNLSMLATKINAVLAKVSVDSNVAKFACSRVDIDHDLTLDSLAKTIKPEIEASKYLNTLSYELEAFIPRVLIRIKGKDLSFEHAQLNIAHDLLDAVSYELQGIDHNTGQATGKTIDEIKTFVSKRLGIIQYHLPSDSESSLFAETGNYVLKNLRDVMTLEDLAGLGEYIDSNVPKLVMVRRWWAL